MEVTPKDRLPAVLYMAQKGAKHLLRKKAFR